MVDLNMFEVDQNILWLTLIMFVFGQERLWLTLNPMFVFEFEQKMLTLA